MEQQTTFHHEIRKPRHRNYWIRPLYLLLVGLGILVSGIVLGAMNAKLSDWVIVEGTVSSVSSTVRQDASGDTERRYSYGVSYEVDGRQYRASGTSTTNVADGSAKQVAYNPANPAENVIGPAPSWVSPVFIGGGLLALVAAVLYFVAGRWRQRQ